MTTKTDGWREMRQQQRREKARLHKLTKPHRVKLHISKKDEEDEETAAVGLFARMMQMALWKERFRKREPKRSKRETGDAQGDKGL